MVASVEYRHVPVKEIDREDHYQISNDPNIGYPLRWPDDYFVQGDPYALPSRLIDHFTTSFPAMQRMIFKPAQFWNGSLSAVELDYTNVAIDYTKWGGDKGYFDFGGHICLITCKRGLHYKHNDQDTFSLRIEDRGSLRIIGNELVFTESQQRNGKLSMSTFGHTVSEPGYPSGMMAGFIDIHGDRPGELITASREFIRDFVKEQKYLVWRKE